MNCKYSEQTISEFHFGIYLSAVFDDMLLFRTNKLMNKHEYHITLLYFLVQRSAFHSA